MRTIESLNELGVARERVEINWIKAHNNYSGNERADELARNSVYHNIVNFNIEPPFSEIKANLNQKLMEEWDEEWQNEDSCRLTKIFYPTMHKGKAKELANLSSRRLIEVVSGQNNLHYIQKKITGNTNLCRLCEEEEETFDHFVNECPCITQTRKNYFGLDKIINSHQWKICTVLAFSNIPAINSALEETDS